jgi:TonB family protein
MGSADKIVGVGASVAAMQQSGAPASAQRRQRRVRLLPITVHIAVAALVISLAGPPPSGSRTGAAARPARGASVRARPQREPGRRARVAPLTVRSLPDVTISYENAESSASPDATATDAVGDTRRSGIGPSIAVTLGASGIANIYIPQPAVSRARPPRPKHDYSNLRIPGASKFAGDIVKVELTIDVHGNVRRVQLLQGVNRELDRKTVALVRTFEYQPALDDDGVATEGTSRWDVQIVRDDDDDMFDSAREHVHR